MPANGLTPSFKPGQRGFSRALAGGLRLLAAPGPAGAIIVSLFTVMQALIECDALPAGGDRTAHGHYQLYTPKLDPPRGPRNPDLDALIAPPPAALPIVAEAQPQPVEGGFPATNPTIDQVAVGEHGSNRPAAAAA